MAASGLLSFLSYTKSGEEVTASCGDGERANKRQSLQRELEGLRQRSGRAHR
jgi:hypothetical protein